MSEAKDTAMDRVYDAMWQSGKAAFGRGEVQVDGYLRNREEDRRRGLTVILRLEDAVAHAIEVFVAELKQVEPGQYFYSTHQYHVTVLSLRTATIDYVHESDVIAAYKRALGEALEETPAFVIRFEGTTATPEAILIRGFPEQDMLNRLRVKISETMAAQGLVVRQRYVPTTAHVTVMRFSRPGRNLAALTESVRCSQALFFGATRVRKIELVENDWYMSPDRFRLVHSYAL